MSNRPADKAPLAWGIAIAGAISILMILIGNHIRIGAIKRYRGQVT
jgi:hypothetical protein